MDERNKKILAFLLRFFPDAAPADHKMVFSYLDKSEAKPRMRNKAFTKLNLVAGVQWAMGHNAEGKEVYFSPALRVPDVIGRGKKSECSTLVAYVAEVDIGGVGHKNSELNPPTEEEAIKIWGDVTPTVAFNSGGGIHGYFFLEEPLVFSSSAEALQADQVMKTFNKTFTHNATALGYSGDTEQGHIASAWRLPYSDNQKTGTPRPVRLISSSPTSLFPFTPSQRPSAAPQHHQNTNQVVQVGSLKKRLKNEDKSQHSESFKLLFAGKQLPAPEGLDNTLQKLTSAMAFADRGRSAPEALAELFVPSMQHWLNPAISTTTLPERMDKIIDQLSRAQDRFFQLEEEKKQDIKKGLEDTVGKSGEGLGAEHLILVAGTKEYYPYSFRKKAYLEYAMQGKDNLLAFIRRDWKSEHECPVPTMKFVGDKAVKRSAGDYLEDNSTQIGTLSSSFNTDQIKVEGNELSRGGLRFRLPSGLRREGMKAEENPVIHEWLMSMAGKDPILRNALLVWLAGAYRTDKRAVIVYLQGPKQAGKSTFINGLAARYQNPAQELETFVGDFNSALTSCPIWFVDEKADIAGKDIAAFLRKLVQQRQRSINEKHKCRLDHEGYGRIIVAANDNQALASKHNSKQSEDGRMATAERILYLEITDVTKDIMLSEVRKGTDIEKSWVIDGGIAKHIMYLAEKHQGLVQGNPERFLGAVDAEEDPNSFRKSLLLAPANELTSDMTVWFQTLLSKLSGKSKRNVIGDEDIAIVKDGMLGLSQSFIAKTWNKWDEMTSSVPRPAELSTFLKNCALHKTKKSMRKEHDSISRKYWVISFTKLEQQMDQGIMAMDELHELLAQIGLDKA